MGEVARPGTHIEGVRWKTQRVFNPLLRIYILAYAWPVMNFQKYGRGRLSEAGPQYFVCCTSGCTVWPQLAPAGKHAASGGGQHDRLELEMSQCQCDTMYTQQAILVKTTLQTCKNIRGTSLLEVPSAPSFAQDGHSLQVLLRLRLSDKHGIVVVSHCAALSRNYRPRLLLSLRENPNLQTKARKKY